MRRLCERYRGLGLRLLVLFGSRARGDHHEDSDIDVLVVADRLPRDPREAYEILADPEEPLLHPIGLPTDAFLEALREARPFILEALEDGIVICADPSFQELVERLYREARSRWVRVGDAWVRVEALRTRPAHPRV